MSDKELEVRADETKVPAPRKDAAALASAAELEMEGKTHEEMEAIISRDLRAGVRVGAALAAIRDRQTYLATHATFEAYVRERWGFTSDRRAYQLIAAAGVKVTATLGGGDEGEHVFTPETEAQARPLTTLATQAEQAVAWQGAVTSAGGQPTKKQVEAAVAEVADRRSTGVAGTTIGAARLEAARAVVKPTASDGIFLKMPDGREYRLADGVVIDAPAEVDPLLAQLGLLDEDDDSLWEWGFSDAETAINTIDEFFREASKHVTVPQLARILARSARDGGASVDGAELLETAQKLTLLGVALHRLDEASAKRDAKKRAERGW